MVSTRPAKGTRDFLPDDVRRREYVIRVIREVYELHDFQPLQTPTLERIDTLLGKYGDEGDQLIFRVMRRGASLHRALQKDAPSKDTLADLGLRYDLTVPLARVVAEHSGALPAIFKRYRIQPVWRADKPQKGRFREFFQCDVDITGCTEMIAEAEVMGAVAMVLGRLGFEDTRIRLNHRDVLFGLIEVAGIDPALETDTLVGIDKLDKIGWEGVEAELAERGVSAAQVAALKPLLAIQGTVEETLGQLGEALASSERGARGVAELRALWSLARGNAAGAIVDIDASLARGLSYYTGPIFEVASPAFSGSLGGGGRYDNLIGMFQKSPVPAVGFSLGLERLIVLMDERGMYPEDLMSGPDVMVAVMNADTAPESVRLAAELRGLGVRVALYPGVQAKMGKQFKYADSVHARFVALIGPDEVASGTVAIKNLATREQVSVPRGEVADRLLGRLETT